MDFPKVSLISVGGDSTSLIVAKFYDKTLQGSAAVPPRSMARIRLVTDQSKGLVAKPRPAL